MRSRSNILNGVRFILSLLVLLGTAGGPAVAQELLLNGDFEQLGGPGSSFFNDWSKSDQSGGSGTWFVQQGAFSPLNGLAVPLPPGGSTAAMTDAFGPGAHVLYQDFTVPTNVGSGTLEFDYYINNLNTDFFTPGTLDYNAPVNQQARVDFITTSADVFSVDPNDVLLNVFSTLPGTPATFGYTTETFDVTAVLQQYAGQTLRLRFAEADNLNALLNGVDNVSLTVSAASVPEPGGALLLMMSISACVCCWKRSHLRRSV